VGVHDVKRGSAGEGSGEPKSRAGGEPTTSWPDDSTEQPRISSQHRERVSPKPRPLLRHVLSGCVAPGIDVSDAIQQAVAADRLMDDIPSAGLATEERNVVAPIDEPRHLSEQERLRPFGKRVEQKCDPESSRRSFPLAGGSGHRAWPAGGFVARKVTVTGKS